MKRLNKEYKISVNNSFSTKYGTTNSLNPEVLYIIGNTYIAPLFSSDDYSDSITFIKNSFGKILKKEFGNNEYFDSRTILNLEIYEKCIKQGKKTFMHFEIYMKQKNVRNISLLEDVIENITFSICNSIENSIKNENFSLSIRK